jgi:hypothetical protein
VAHFAPLFNSSEFVEAVDDDRVQEAVRSLFIEKKDDASSDSNGAKSHVYSFADEENFEAILHDKPYDLSHFQDKFEALILRMNTEVYEKDRKQNSFSCAIVFIFLFITRPHIFLFVSSIGSDEAKVHDSAQ